MAYIGTSPSNGVRRVFDYTATAGQTSFSGSDNNSQTLAYTDSAYIDVYQNGILLIPSDYTATTGTTVVLDTGATVSDTVQIVAYDVFSVADTVSASDGGSFGGNLGVGGTLSVTGIGTFSDDIIIGDGKTIGSTSDVDAMTISSGGVVTFSQQPVGTAMVKLLDATISSAVSEYDIDSTYINSTYNDYMISFNFKPATDGVKLYSRVFVGGAVQDGSIYGWETSSPVHGNTNNNGTTYFQYTHDNTGNATGEYVSGKIDLTNVNNTDFCFNYSGLINSMSTGGSHGGYMAVGSLITTSVASVVNGFRFYFSSGNIASGTVKVYGLA